MGVVGARPTSAPSRTGCEYQYGKYGAMTLVGNFTLLLNCVDHSVKMEECMHFYLFVMPIN